MGHVFVLPGDITRFACDAWLLPTDRRVDVTPGWRRSVPGLDAALASADTTALRTEATWATALPAPGDGPRPVLTAVPPLGVRTRRDVEERVGAGLAEAARVAGPGRRGTPLLAMPLFGSAAGGGDDLRGELVRAALDTARRTTPDADVALVLREPADLALAHEYRRRDPDRWWPELDDTLRGALTGLAEHARRGRLVPFVGSGVSVSAGLPTWDDLIRDLSRDRLAPESAEEFRRLSVLDQAEVLEDLHGSRAAFTSAIADRTRATRYGLAPALLAGLPTTEAVTLNYDELYEMAAADARRPVAVLPGEAADAGGRWLLKLHGSVSEPQSIVLTRRDYLGYRKGREALSALAKALLLTRHLLFVGFGLADDHFHEVVHDVRSVLPRRRRVGTALVLAPSPLRDKLWSGELDFVPVGGDGADDAARARRQEIALDHLLAHADRGLGHVLDPRFRELLTDDEARLADRLSTLARAMTPGEAATPAGVAVGELLTRLGHDDLR